MNIDLLLTADYRAGLICDQNLVTKAGGVVVDTDTGLITLEYADMDFLELNIPVDDGFFAVLEYNPQIHIGAVKEGHIAQAYQVPLMFLNDPYRAQKMGHVRQSRNPLLEFEYFIKNAATGQPVHRDDLSDEDTMGCVLGSAMPSSLQFAPHLAKTRALEAAPKIAPTLTHGPAGPGLGGGGSRTNPARPIKRAEDEED